MSTGQPSLVDPGTPFSTPTPITRPSIPAQTPAATPSATPAPIPLIKPPKPDTYDGKRDGQTIHTWLFAFAQYRTYYGLSEHTAVTTASLWFRKDAATWWEFR